MEENDDKAEPKSGVQVKLTLEVNLKSEDKIELTLEANTKSKSEAKIESTSKAKDELKSEVNVESTPKAKDEPTSKVKINSNPDTHFKAPESKSNGKDDLRSLPLLEVEKKLGASKDGLTQAEASIRLTQYGPNELEEKKTNLLLKFLLLLGLSHG